MKKQITATVATLSLIIALAAIGFAGLGARLTANIPFDFTINGKTMPAGQYTVGQGTTPYTLIIRNADKGVAAATIVQSAKNTKEKQAKLTFHRYGNQHFLASVDDGFGTSQDLPVSNAERKAARGKDHLAMKAAAPEIVTINATVGQ